MSDTISIILEYLRRHHFSKAEAVLREEVISRGSNGLLPFQLDDDELDLDVSMHLQSVVEEKAAGLGQQTVLKFTHDKVGPDTEKYVPMELKQGLQGWLGSEKKEKLHLLNADKLQPLPKVEEPGILFTNFKVEEQEQPTNNNGLHTAEQALVRTSLIPGFTEEADLVYYGKNRGGEFNAQSKEKSELENGFQENSSSGSKCVEWTDIPIKTIPIMKTNVSLATEPASKTGNRGSDVVVREGKHLQDVASDKEWYQTASERDLTSQASSEQESVSQVAVAGLVQSEGKRQLGQQLTHGEKHAQNDHSKKTAVIEGPVEGELPKLPPVRLRSNDPKTPESGAGVGFAFGNRSNLDTAPFEMLPLPVEPAVFGLGSYLDVPVGQDISSSGSRRLSASARPSVSHGIVEDTSELLSGFATVGDGQSESAVDYPDDYWDSDTYEDDDDPGYHRQPIEDEEWFLAHEIDYPSEDERAHPSVEKLQRIDHEKDSEKDDDDNHSCIKEEQSFFSGEEYYHGKRGDEWQESERDLDGLHTDDLFGHVEVNQVEYERPHLDSDALTLMRGEPGWQGFESLKEGFPEQDGSDKSVQKRVLADGSTYDGDDDRVGSVRFSGLGVRSDVAEFGSELRGSLLGGSSEGDLENAEIEMETSSGSSFPFEPQDYRKLVSTKLGTKGIGEEPFHKNSDAGGGSGFGGFSFPSPSTSGGDIATVSRVDSGKSLWSVRDISAQAPGEEGEDFGNGLLVIDDPLASWRRKSNDSSPKFNMGDRAVRNIDSDSTDGYGREEHDEDALLEDDQHIRDAEAVAAEDEEAAAVQEQIRRIQAEEDEFETFNLKIIHRKNRTGFEEDKDFPVVLNAVIAGRYHVTEYLGSAAFSKAIQAHDLHTGMDVCMKIIKNNKDFFDQSLDEIKLLKYINKNDPVDKHHLLRLYDYFYHREHLFIVCELLRANLYEFHKYNRESGGEVYFTMPRLQSITRQCLEALEFIHGLGLIHCDLKPENILVKSYSRCEIKVIDLGSSCFQTDHLCSYVQSRSYRAPEVILGLPYNQKIDMWSLGCILAELCSGNVLFQNDSLATLLARVVGILGPIDPALLAKGKDTHKFFTKNHMLYERNQDSDQLEYLLPKKTSLAHRLPMGDQGFVEFVAYLLQIDPTIRPSATEALQHPWLSYPYEPISS
ncbi:unnamed protein product [Sphagnum troendelagicum]|uniref:Protein kinase domain-containing protein n=1 Tax=Sphagnum troendelagicum TaxID=128251 RepID=A0ABP0UD75_9BRYO